MEFSLHVFLVTVLFLASGQTSFAQEDNDVKLLKTKLTQKLSDSVKISVYNQLADLINKESEWMEYNRKALDLAGKGLSNNWMIYV